MVDRRMEGNKTLITDKETSTGASTNGVAYEEEEEAMESAAPKFAQLKATKRDLSGAIDATNAIPRRVGHRSNGGGGRRRSTRKRRGKTRRLADAAMNEHQHGEEQRHGDKSDNDVEQRHEEITLSTRRETKDNEFKIAIKQKNKRHFRKKLTRNPATMVTPVTSPTASFASAIGARVEFCQKNWRGVEV